MVKENVGTDYKILKEYLNDTVETDNWFRLGRAFKTKYAYYFYDSGTGKIFEVRDDVYHILNTLTKTNDINRLDDLNITTVRLCTALEEILRSIQEEHILSIPELTSLTGPQVTNLCGNLKKAVKSITLEITEQCNLRCRYCIYDGETNVTYREHGTKYMSEETAKKAVDFLLSHSLIHDAVYIGFYGGEPLLNWRVIEKVINYVASKNLNKPVYYNMTTNLTLMTKEIADFISKTKNFSVLVSLDGPKEINDENRIYQSGKGAFDTAIKGYQLLLDAFKARKDSGNNGKIMFNCVIPEPDDNKLNKINEFFMSLDPEEAGGVKNITLSRIFKSSEQEDYIKPLRRGENQLNVDVRIDSDPLIDWGQSKTGEVNNITRSYSNTAFAMIHKRPISDLPIENFPMNGCCIPGARKLYVTADGSFLPCERLGAISTIGDVYEGYNVFKIKKEFVKEFIGQAVKYCGDCWAVHICKNCYINCFDREGNIDLSYRHNTCRNHLVNLENDLISYHELLIENPEYIESLNEIEMV